MAQKSVNQVFTPSQYPSDEKVRMWLLDVGRITTKELYVDVCGSRILLDSLNLQPPAGCGWVISGEILRFPTRPQHEGRSFTLALPFIWFTRSKREAEFTIHGVPLLTGKECECCGDGTVYEFDDDGYVCPNCSHRRPPIRLWKKPEVHGPSSPKCMNCGVVMQRAGSCYACPSCGATSGCT